MNDLTAYWPDLIALGLGIVFFTGALTGRFSAQKRRPGDKPTSSPRARLLFFFIAMGFVAWVVYDLRHRLHL